MRRPRHEEKGRAHEDVVRGRARKHMLPDTRVCPAHWAAVLLVSDDQGRGGQCTDSGRHVHPIWIRCKPSDKLLRWVPQYPPSEAKELRAEHG